MDTKLIAKIRQSVLKAKQEGRGRRVRYPAFVKESVVKLLRAGASGTELSRLVGISAPTLFQWAQLDEATFRKVLVSEPKSVSSPGLSIILPNGLRIECATVSCLADALEVLK